MAHDSIFDGLAPQVAAALNDARRVPSVDPDLGLIALMAAAAAASPLNSPPMIRRKSMLGKIVTAKALALAGALALSGGVAAAATGTLPDQVQAPVANTVEHVGVHIPNGEHGAAVSDVAHQKDGDNHGADVSGTARDNHGHEGDDTTPATIAGEDGPGNSQGHANGHATEKSNKGSDDGTDDDSDDDTITTAPGETTTTTVDDESGDSSSEKAPTTGQSHGGHGSDD